MAIRMTRPWRPLDAAGLAGVAGHLGVYQLAAADGTVLYIGHAGGRSTFGLRGELLRWIERGGARQFRVEITTAYRTRWLELLMVHRADHGTLPPLNDDVDATRLGRLSPA